VTTQYAPPASPPAARSRAAKEPVTAWDAIRLPPLKFLTSSWPWRAFTYLVTSSIFGLALLLMLMVMVGVGVLASITIIGAALLVAIPLVAMPVAAFERFRLGLVDREPAPSPHKYVPTRPFRRWLKERLTEGATWRELAYAFVVVSAVLIADLLGVFLCVNLVGVPLASILMPTLGDDQVQLFAWTIDSWGEAGLFVLLLPLGYAFAAYLACVVVGARAKIARVMLVGSVDAPQYVEAVDSRARLVDAFEAERRRIERDLHDGTQAHLVSLAFRLGVAELELARETPDNAEARKLVKAAHGEAKEALQELRDLIRGIHPQVLTDRGLSAAVAEVAGRSAVPVQLDLRLDRRLPPPVESAAYFVVTEALTNVARHSQASVAFVRAWHDGHQLIVGITDNGVGGADPARGSGLQGLADRLAVVAGRLILSSPPGGPTVLTLEIPCPTIGPVPSRS
jgi:signal transduction histidine kinase